MTPIVVDASVAVKWLLPEESSGDAVRWLAAEYELMAPDLLWAELGNVLWKKCRRRELEARTAAALLRDFARMPLRLHAAERWAGAALELALRHGVTVYDALYLALAAGHACRLVTADRRLHEACRAGVLQGLVTWVADTR